jgi:hypothetical protein
VRQAKRSKGTACRALIPLQGEIMAKYSFDLEIELVPTLDGTEQE